MDFFDVIALGTFASILVHGRLGWLREWFLVVVFVMALMHLHDIDMMYRRMWAASLDPRVDGACARQYFIGWTAAAQQMQHEQTESTSRIRTILYACFVTLVGGWLADWSRASWSKRRRAS